MKITELSGRHGHQTEVVEDVEQAISVIERWMQEAPYARTIIVEDPVIEQSGVRTLEQLRQSPPSAKAEITVVPQLVGG